MGSIRNGSGLRGAVDFLPGRPGGVSRSQVLALLAGDGDVRKCGPILRRGYARAAFLSWGCGGSRMAVRFGARRSSLRGRVQRDAGAKNFYGRITSDPAYAGSLVMRP